LKKKSIKLMILTAMVIASFTTNVVYAAKPNFNEKNTNKIEQKQENYNKKISKETYTLSKRLDQIENSYKKVNVKLEEYFNESNTSQTTTDTPTDTTDSTATTDTPTETTTDNTATTDTPTETTTDSTATTDVPTETTTDSTATTDTPTDTTTDNTATTDTPTETTTDSIATTDTPTETTTDSTATTDTPTETTTDSTATTDVPTETTTDSTATTDVPTERTTDGTATTDVPTETTTDTEMENEYENEDSQVNNSFYGKLNAIMNKLNTVKRQLNRLSSSNSEDISNLNNRTDELINQVKASMDKVSNIQSENVTSLKSKSDKKIMENQNVNEQKKSWKIHFTKSVDSETINSKNIMVVDSKNNIVDVDVSYNQDSNDIIIEAKDGFIKSQSYSILISSDVKSADGKRLPKTIEKRFSVQ